MKAYEVISRLETGIPRQAEWSKGEPYGAFHVKPYAEIKRILYCVTPTEDVVDYFLKHGYDLLVSHHPFVTAKIPQAIFHTALDCCEGGLNDQWKDAIGLSSANHFDGTLGWHGSVQPILFSELVKCCEKFVGQKVLGQTFSNIQTIKSVVICSGLGGLVTSLARKTGADCYILGEALEPASKMGFPAVIEVGHTLSERIGVSLIRALLPSVQVDCAPLSLDRFGHEVFCMAG